MYGLAFGLAAYGVMLLLLGYAPYGESEPTFLASVHEDPSFWLSDFHVAEYLKKPFHWRSLPVFFLRFLAFTPLLKALWHGVFSVILFIGLWRMAYHFIGHPSWSSVAVLLVLPFLYHLNWGSNELYYNHLHPSLPAKALASWVWVGFLERKAPRFALSFLLLSTFFHVQVGFHTAVLSLPFWRRALPKIRLLEVVLLCLLGALFGWVFLQNQGFLSQEMFYSYGVHFRLNLHFDPKVFPLSRHLFFGFFLVAILILAWRRAPDVFLSFLLLAGLISLYLWDLYFFRMGLASLQVPRATVWVKPFFVFLLLGYLRGKGLLTESFSLPAASWLVVAAVEAFLLWRLARYPQTATYYAWQETSLPEVQLAQKMHQVLPPSALVAGPFDIPHLSIAQVSHRHWYSMPGFFAFGKTFLPLYAERVRNLYGLVPPASQSWSLLAPEANRHYYALCHEPDSLRRWGITHLVTPDSMCLELPLVICHGGYKVYSLVEKKPSLSK
ncbi:MAG: hypothetical protein ACUVRD_00680 [Bacteroidia bacterium]